MSSPQRIIRILKVAGLLFGLFMLVAAGVIWVGLCASLPKLDGQVILEKLGAVVTIDRDAAGVPTISAVNRIDLARGLGYVHGQDRFFQMDLLRRAAAGELSALLGPALIEVDRHVRLHRLREVARSVVSGLDPHTRALLDAYVDGVNAGMTSLRSRPFEYWLLQSRPQTWRAEDSVLCVHAMYLQLQDSEGHAQLQRGLLRATLPEALWRFLEAGAPEWDADVDGSRTDEPKLPTAEEFDLRSLRDLPVLPPDQVLRRLGLVGSNNWAVAGSHTTNGAAVIANDMHLEFRVPNIWYRARLVQSSATAAIDVTGVTLPGTPSIVAGSNGSIAWGFTNSYGQFATVIRLVPVANGAEEYQTARGPRHFRYVQEVIHVKGATSEPLRVAETQWGPVVGTDWEGKPYALQWTAHDPNATNLNLLELEQAHSVDDALHTAANFGIPGQNFLVADKAGHIGWTIAGRLPIRSGLAAGIPQSSTDAAVGYSAWLAPEQQPRIMDPPQGILWSANARVVGGSADVLIGDDGMDRGARASQIHADLLAASRPFAPPSSLAVQLDDRALFLERWRSLLVEILNHTQLASGHEHDAARTVLATWSGHAAPTDAAYRLVELFRAEVEARAFFMLVSPARGRAAKFRFEIPSAFEGPLWRLIRQRPAHMLAARYSNWDQFLVEALRESEKLPPVCRTLVTCGWGQVNRVHIEHPLSRALPHLSRFLDMPQVSVAGGREDMPRIQGADFGASERFSVSPGSEGAGYFHMPGGQSGHPLSPFYRFGFDSWAQGQATAFLPGAARHTLVLMP